MTNMRYPGHIWTWWLSAAAVALAATPAVLAAGLDPAHRTWSTAALVTQLAITPMLLAAAVALYVQYRVEGGRIFAWLTLGTALMSVQVVSMATLRLDGPRHLLDDSARIQLVDLLVVMLMLVLSRCSLPERWWPDPLAAGVLAGVVLTAVQVRLLDRLPALHLSGETMLGVHTVVALAASVGAVLLLRSLGLPAWAGSRLGAAGLLFVVNRAASSHPDDGPVAGLLMMGTGTVGTVLLVGVTTATLRWTFRSQVTQLEHVSDQLAQAEADLREQRARLHEITNSIAGIASASSLIQHRVHLPPSHRLRLEHMLERESARLARLLERRQERHGEPLPPLRPPTPRILDPNPNPNPDPDPGPARVATRVTTDCGHDEGMIDLDDVLTPLVVAQEAVGHPVVWVPSGLRAHGDADVADDLAEAVNILLDNARKHAGSAAVLLSVQATDDRVRIVVADDGPGIAPEVEQNLFAWGRPGERSGGQGIGLHVAHQLLDDAGATLELEHTEVGTTFVITLPSRERIAL